MRGPGTESQVARESSGLSFDSTPCPNSCRAVNALPLWNGLTYRRRLSLEKKPLLRVVRDLVCWLLAPSPAANMSSDRP
jgi:hypothetical protein